MFRCNGPALPTPVLEGPISCQCYAIRPITPSPPPPTFSQSIRATTTWPCPATAWWPRIDGGERTTTSRAYYTRYVSPR